MCGISLVTRFTGSLSNEDIATGRQITAAMERRGPDGEGHWVSDDRRVYMGHRRLAIIDLSDGGAQPMRWVDRGLNVTYNGEIYNYRELRGELEKRGHTFVTASDTEVILHGYGEWGADVLTRLRGMFAFAIWDDKRKEALLARDPYGIKPLYYAVDDGVLRVASQVKALIAGGGVDDRPDPAGWVGFLLFGWVPEPWTTHAGIRSLPAGTWLRATAEGIGEPRRYASLAEAIAGPSDVDENDDLREIVREALLDSVRAHLTSDVPVGAFLSAGVDSGTLVALMRELGYEDIRTVTLGFEEFRGTSEDEVPLAEETATRYGTRHTTRIIGREEFLQDWPRILEAMDQPSVDGANTWLVSKVAREAGLKVVVSGVGGDELFGGYPSFRDIPRWVHAMRRLSIIPFARTCGYLMARGASSALNSVSPKLPAVPRYGGSFAGAYFARRGLFMPWELHKLVDPDFARTGLASLRLLDGMSGRAPAKASTDLAQVMTLECSLYLRNQLLRDADWASMDHSLELRTPLVDWHMLNALGPSLGCRKAPGKEMLASTPRSPLPSKYQSRPKTGFGLPTMTWLTERSAGDAQNMKSGYGAISRAMAVSLSKPATLKVSRPMRMGGAV